MNKSDWKNRTVLITGHTGFKGSWLTLWLTQLGAKVIGYSLPPPTKPNLFTLADVGRDIVSVEGDVRNLSHLQAVMKEHEPEVVFHLAANPLVRFSYQNPVQTYAVNVMGTVHFLEAVRLSPSVQTAVVITSDKCYENREWVWGYRESDPMGGFDPYSSSKGCAELITTAYRQSFLESGNGKKHTVAIASARAGNVIGGGDWAPDRLVPDVMRSFLEKKPVHIRYPGAIRPWQHVLEPLAGYLRLAECLSLQGSSFAGGWNFGPVESAAQPVAYLVQQLAKLWGSEARWSYDKDVQPHEDNFLRLDCSKSRTRLGWKPQFDLETALSWVVDWYSAYAKGEDIRRVTLNQLGEYIARLENVPEIPKY